VTVRYMLIDECDRRWSPRVFRFNLAFSQQRLHRREHRPINLLHRKPQ
jgi:hypothetical protein